MHHIDKNTSLIFPGEYAPARYVGPAELTESIRSRIAEEVSPFQRETYFFFIGNPDAPLTSVEEEAVGVVEVVIKKKTPHLNPYLS